MKSFKEYLNESLTNDDLVRARYFGKKAYSRRIENNPKKDVVFVNGFLNGMDVKTHSKLEKEYKKGYEEAKKDEDSSKLRATKSSQQALKQAKQRRELEKIEAERKKEEEKKLEKNPYYKKTIEYDVEDVTCDKCGGAGYIENFKHNRMGECFKCKTKGTLKQRVKKVKWVFDQKKYDKDHPNADWWEGMIS